MKTSYFFQYFPLKTKTKLLFLLILCLFNHDILEYNKKPVFLNEHRSTSLYQP